MKYLILLSDFSIFTIFLLLIYYLITNKSYDILFLSVLIAVVVINAMILICELINDNK